MNANIYYDENEITAAPDETDVDKLGNGENELKGFKRNKRGEVRFNDHVVIDFSRSVSDEKVSTLNSVQLSHNSYGSSGEKCSNDSRKTLSQRIAIRLLDNKIGWLRIMGNKLSDFLSKKKAIVIIFLGCFLSFVFMIINWNGNDLINNSLSIFLNIVNLIFLLMQAFKSKDEDEELREQVKETRNLLHQALQDKEKEEERITQLIETINGMRNFGSEEFKRLVEDLKCGGVDKAKISEIMSRQKTLIDRLIEVTIQNEIDISDKDLIEFGKSLKGIILFEELSNEKNLSKKQKSAVRETMLYASKILKAYVEKRNILKNFEFQRNRLSAMMEEEDLKLETKSFKSIRLSKTKSEV